MYWHFYILCRSLTGPTIGMNDVVRQIGLFKKQFSDELFYYIPVNSLVEKVRLSAANYKNL